MKKGKMVLFLAVLASLFLMAQGGRTVYAASGTDSAEVSVTYMQTEARSMLESINDFRTGSDAWYWDEDDETQITCSGLSELNYDYDLEKVAMQRAAEIALYFSHTRPNNSTCWTAYSEAAYSYSYGGENIAYGTGTSFASASGPFTAWQETNYGYDGQGHRRNMLGSNYNVCAIACVCYNGAYYWVQEFARTSNSSTSTSANDSAATVSVEIAADALSSLALTASTESISLSEGGSVSLPTLTAQIVFSGGGKTVSVSVPCTWTVGNTSIGTVSSGKLTAKKLGTTKLTASFLGESVSVPVTVSKDLSACTVTLGTTSYTYDGSAKKPSVTVKDGSTTLTSGTDYTLSYSSNTNAGTATVKVTGKGNYTGSVSKTFTIGAASLSNASVTLSQSSYTYDGSAKKPSVTVKSGDTTLGSADYAVSYSDNTNAGTAAVTVTGKGNYTGTAKKTFTIEKASQTLTVTVSSKTIAKGKTATITAKGKGKISYSSSKKSVATVSSSGKITAKAPGKAKITVKAAGNSNFSSASRTLTIKVNPKATSLKSVKSSSSKKMVVKWKKVSGVSGYQIQYSTNKKFKSGNKTKKVSGASKVSKTLSSLKKGKTYYVRVRTYKKVSGTTYYSSWSSKKKVKVK